MDYVSLGRTNLKVSRICLGTMTWGQQNTEAEAHEQMDYALAQGVNFFDTAEMYPVPPKEETYSLTEQYIGSWFAARKNREQVILATKVAGPGDWLKYVRGGGSRLNREHIRAACDASLKRLQTDYIDLYQLHWPERVTNFFGTLGYFHKPEKDGVPLEESLAALDELVKEGKVRHVGVSNETPWGLSRYLRLSEERGLARPASIQNPYSLVNRTFEIGLAEIALREECGLLAYSPLAFGALTGKYLNGQRPADGRLTLFTRFQRYTNAQTEQAIERYVAIAREAGLDPAQMALAFVNSRPFLTSTIIGATSMDQLKTNIASHSVTLASDVLKQIEAVHKDIPNPAP